MGTMEARLLRDIGEKRYQHSLRVVEMGLRLAEAYNADLEKTRIAALLHDCGKIEGQTNLLKTARDFGIILDDYTASNGDLIHAPLGAYIARTRYKVDDEDILGAIRYHTTGRKGMSLLEKIIYIADYIELGREFPGLDQVRDCAFKNLDRGMLMALDKTIKYLIDEKKLIHPQTVEARNYLIMEAGL
ncbi:MAG: bis(5'-nucleosyl)-tetraphosphatase (symmetrical) YqeK [Tissierellaceae bacterium]